MTQNNEIMLLNDILMYITTMPRYGIYNMIEYVYIFIFRRNFSYKNKSDFYLIWRVDHSFNKNREVNTKKKIRVIWGLLTPLERTEFVNKYILQDEP
jgi:hypothetical protein